MNRVWTLGLATVWSAAAVLPLNAGEIVLDVPGATLREVLTKVFDGQDVAVEWLDKDAADLVVRGHYDGLIHDIAISVLSQTDFSIAYDSQGGIRRIIVKGRTLSQKATPSLPSAEPVRIQLKQPEAPVQLTNDDLRQRITSSPILRTQAAMTVPFQRDNTSLIPPRRSIHCFFQDKDTCDSAIETAD